MEELKLEQFNPTKQQVTILAEKYKSLTISGIDDVEGYKAVHTAQMELVHTRTDIVKASKIQRQKAVDFNKAVLALEKDLIAIIEPVEDKLKEMKDKIDQEKILIERKKVLPQRKEKLAELEYELPDEEILKMDATAFQECLNEAKHLQLLRKEDELRIKQEKIDSDRIEIEKQQREDAIRKKAEDDARTKAAEDARLAALKAKQDKIDAVEAVKLKAAQDKQKLIDEQKKKDDARIAAEEAVKKDNADRLFKEAADRQALEQTKKMLNFLKKNGVTEDNKKDFIINHDGPLGLHITLWKKIDEIDL